MRVCVCVCAQYYITRALVPGNEVQSVTKVILVINFQPVSFEILLQRPKRRLKRECSC